MTDLLQEKSERLLARLRGFNGCLVAFSGGVDSTFLLAMAHRALGERCLAVTATSSTYPERERLQAQRLAQAIGARHRFIVSEELDCAAFVQNTPDRCYHCKSELFVKLADIARVENLQAIVDGFNVDDHGDYRPGRRAAQERGVLSPLEEAGLTKDDIRELSRRLGLPTWDQPAMACLSSRFPYGEPITREKLAQVERAEAGLRDLGIRVLRVRHHGDVARIEVGVDEIANVAVALRDKALAIVKEAGFAYVALDLEGYRTGAMNETLPGERT